MHALRRLAVVLVLLLVSFPGRAQAIPMQALVDGGQIAVFDKVFSNWLLFGTSTLTPDLGQIEVRPLDDDPLNPGLTFSFNNQLQFTAATAGHEELFDFGFTVSTISGLPLIKDNSLSLTGFDFSSDPDSGGLIEIDEVLRDGTIAFTGKVVSADNFFQDFNLFDRVEFLPRTQMNVDVLTTMFADFQGDFLRVESFELRFSQVPEPGTLILVGAGLGLLGLMSRRRAK